MKVRRLIASAFVVLFAAFAVRADTPVPQGYAIYELTLTMTEFPELDDYGSWPLVIETLLGADIVGERTYVDPANTQLVTRAIFDIGAMIDYSTNTTYLARSGYQMWMYLCCRYHNSNSAGGQNNGGWVSTNAKLDFSTTPRTVEAFAQKLSDHFKNRTMWMKSDYGGSETVSTYKSLTFKKIRNIGSDPLPNATQKYHVRCSFHQPLSVKGFATVNKIVMSHPHLYSITMMDPVVSSDGCHYDAVVEMNVPEMIAKINSSEYQSSTASGWQGSIGVYGTDANGAAKSVSLVTGANGKLSTMTGTTEVDLAKNLCGQFRFRNWKSTTPATDVRITNFTILRPRSGLVVIVR